MVASRLGQALPITVLIKISDPARHSLLVTAALHDLTSETDSEHATLLGLPPPHRKELSMFDQDTHSTPIGALHVAELARLADVTPATVRYYSRIGLLSPKREPENGYRYFSGADRQRVHFIRRAQSLGLTIGDIKTILGSIDHGEVPCHQVRALVEGRLQSVKEQLAQLKATKTRITQALAIWEDMPDKSPATGELCPLIDRIDESMANAKAREQLTGPHRVRSRIAGNNGMAVAHC